MGEGYRPVRRDRVMQFICVLVESKMSTAVAGWYMWTTTRQLSGLKVIVPLCPLLEKYLEITVIIILITVTEMRQATELCHLCCVPGETGRCLFA